MPRYKLTVEYDGGPFSGWQRQDNAPSVQEALERAAARLAEVPCAVYGAGRTDAGVHATGQVAHVDIPKDLRGDTVRDALNHHLGDAPIAVRDAEEVRADFHARFDAVERAYVYRITDRRPPLALDGCRVWRVAQPLDASAMHAAAQALVGRHDFTTFRDSQCEADSPMRTLDAISVAPAPADDTRAAEIRVSCAARSFLHRQVRSMVGSLVEVGRGKWDPPDLARALEARDRRACGPVAPAHGLYLVRVRYGPSD